MDNPKLVSDIKTALMALEPDVVKRNQYMNDRDRYVYGSGLFDGLDIENWFAEHNYLQRVVDIHTAQLMGRPYNVYSYYDKEDLSPYENDDAQLQLAELKNKKAKSNADTRKRVLDAIRRDNKQESMDKEGARIGSAYGMTAYKQWADYKEKKVKRSLIESPQNLYIFWSNDNFREYDAVAYVYQISADSAYRQYGSQLADGDVFEVTKQGNPFGMSGTGNSNTSDPISQSTNANVTDNGQQTDREMVTVIDLAGYLTGWAADGKGVKEVKRGKETRLGIMIVGGQTVQVITEEKKVPKFYLIFNRIAPRRAIAMSDLPQSALDINREIVQLEADCMTWANKNLFKKYKAKNIAPENLPKWKSRRTQMMSVGDDQDIEEIQVSTQQLQEFRALINEKINNFVRVTNIGRVLFDDPDLQANSNQALMTTMKPVIDIVEDKQVRWGETLVEMDTDALHMSADMIPDLEEAVNTDESWYLCVEWPSVLRREDGAYQQMWLNRFINNTVSLETYLQKMGDPDTSEEVDRLRDELKDPVTAAILGRSVGEVAHQAINKSLGIPPWGYVVPKVSVRGELSPQEMGNIAHNYQWDQGPYGPAIGPQGYEGAQANQDFSNTGFIKDTANGPQPNYQNPAPSPQLTPDQNNPGVPSTAGSGLATPTSSAGAIAKNNQNRGG